MFDYATYLRRLQGGDITLNPFLAFLGIRQEEITEGFARFRMTVKPEYLQGAGLVQGGLMVALADETIAHAIMSVLKENEGLTTVELKSNFLAPVTTGDLIAEANVFKKGRSIIIGDCLIKDDQGRPVLRCTATFLVVAEKAQPPRKDEKTTPVGPTQKKEDDRQTNLF
ncbi:MAG TPA: PaaI family thioesterase [Syntrophales bacterium]|nr:PaaI family thioesterase [Syntrophales bacterium]